MYLVRCICIYLSKVVQALFIKFDKKKDKALALIYIQDTENDNQNALKESSISIL